MSDLKQDYFETIAAGWDDLFDLGSVRDRLRAALCALGIVPGETILDLGCGTGILSGLLLPMLSPGGRIIALDFAEAMIEEARRKLPDSRVSWLQADAAAIPLPPSSVDRVVCFSAWPHFPDQARVADDVCRVLRDGGHLHILHTDTRQKINAVHARAGGAIAGDVLPPVHDLGLTLSTHGLIPYELTETSERYLVSARKAP
jgi:ubiquinone/menaquinone biosynthesis C-methylase UbiE